ncbi:hypothetical protein H6F43_06625 [Leptolyngbya sp. FACHB-36]|uniref:hypothetical protein n=1 Tax=Leptolyngbya sp. FACHB-36 TaxID=2692808 RepID=UPI001680F4FB|nr:hypothetical protein [Leptolyngbya sp. FACHB-36]MBD2019862.1 hypothetical protein [Leptolyngbya sp. FACHB-36]
MELGSTQTTTQSGTLVYYPTLAIAGAAAAGLQSKKVYRISALLQAGAPQGPALTTGHTKTLTIQTYNL